MDLKTKNDLSKNGTLQFFKTLDRLWKRNLIPEQVERHYFLYWFAVCQGDPIQAAEAIRVHPNTVRFHFERLGFSEKSDSLRHLWLELAEKSKKTAFENQFFKFHHSHNISDGLSGSENKILIRLWRTGFSFTAIGAHYMLWALRNRKSKEWIRKKLGYSSHHCMRVLVSILDPRTANGRWLAPLKPLPHEIYSSRRRNSREKVS